MILFTTKRGKQKKRKKHTRTHADCSGFSSAATRRKTLHQTRRASGRTAPDGAPCTKHAAPTPSYSLSLCGCVISRAALGCGLERVFFNTLVSYFARHAHTQHSLLLLFFSRFSAPQSSPLSSTYVKRAKQALLLNDDRASKPFPVNTHTHKQT